MSRELTAAEQAEWDAVVDAEVAAAPALRPDQITRLSALFDYQPPNGGRRG
jgi:hypothetical protein